MVIWSESLDRIVPICQDFEERLIKLLWRNRPTAGAPSSTASNGGAGGASASASLNDHSSAEAGNGLMMGTGAGPRFSRAGMGSRPESRVGGVVRGMYGEQGREYDDDVDEKTPTTSTGANGGKAEDPHDPRAGGKGYKRTWYGRKVPIPYTAPDLEGLAYGNPDGKRPVRLYAPLYNGLAAGIALVFIGNAAKTLLMEWKLDGDFTRFALIAVVPLLYCVSLFFTLQIVQNVTMMWVFFCFPPYFQDANEMVSPPRIGPIAHYHQNSKYYSAVRPRANKEVDNNLPHITIQMPVYKESLEAVLAPSIRSLKKAMQTYARQGGTSTIFINDDGLRLLPAPDRDERLAFYANHNIGWVARPKHENTPDGFKRAGRFKKASNMNYGLALSLKMEKHLEVLMANSAATKEANLQSMNSMNMMRASMSDSNHNHHLAGRPSADRMGGGTQYGIQYQNRDGAESVVWGHGTTSSGAPLASNLVGLGDEDLEEKALGMAIEETWEESGRKWRPWAANGRATRIGELVLIVDSDTVVPEDCLRDAAREMAACPTVAIIQHESGE